MRRMLLLILFIILLGACTKGAIHKKEEKIIIKTKKEEVKKIALLVGVSNYTDKNSDLNGIYKDIKKMKTLFEHLGYKTVVLYDEESMGILKTLNKYGKELSSKDFFAFYYSGHGSYVKDKNGDETDGKDETLVLSDGEINKHLTDDRLDNTFAQIKARKLMIFDSCHSGTVSKFSNEKVQIKTISPEYVTTIFRKSKKNIVNNKGEYVVLSSSRDNENSLMTSEGSLFTQAFDKAISKNRQISFKALITDIRSQIRTYCKNNKLDAQTPQIESSAKGFESMMLQDYLTKVTKILK